MQVLGAAVLAVLYPLGNPFYSLGIMLFEAGVLLAAFSFFRENSWTKKIIGAATLAGVSLQVYGFYAPEEYAGPIILGGIGFVCAGAAGMAGKEACCSKYREGWILMIVLPALVLANLFGKENLLLNAAGFAVVFLALLSLTGKKLRQPLAAQELSSSEVSSRAKNKEP
jgi:uncharacterized membrane protein